MPNHVTNIIEIEDLNGADLSEVRSSFLNKDRKIDFNQIKKPPSCLEGFEPHTDIVSAAKALAQSPISGNLMTARLEILNRENALERYRRTEAEGGFSKEEHDQIKRAVSNIKECGCAYWYEWNSQNWGTKWNAYAQPDNGWPEDAVSFDFETAWAHPIALIKLMSERCAGVTFRIRYADEDTGSNCGSYRIRGGEVFDEDVAPSWSDQTDHQKSKYTKFAFETCSPGKDPRSQGYDENWVYSDEVYDAYEAATEPPA